MLNYEDNKYPDGVKKKIPPKTNCNNFKTRNIDKIWFPTLIATLIS